MPSKPPIRLQVVEGDALAFPADALVLKYAQALYGVDAKAVGVAGIPEAKLPSAGGFRVAANPRGIAAE